MQYKNSLRQLSSNLLHNIWIVIPVVFLLLFLFIVKPIILVNAETQEELEQMIEKRNDDIKQLEKEIESYQKQIDSLGSQAYSLSSTIKSLDLTKKKLEANIKVTEDKITNKTYEITRLSSQIGNKESTIEDDRRIISHAIVLMSQSEDRSVPEIILGSKSLSSAWNTLDELALLQNSVNTRITKLQQDKVTLEKNKKTSEKAKAELVTLNQELKDQRKVVLDTVAEKNSLLKETKQSESEYKKLLAQKQAMKEAFEQEIVSYESKLDLMVNASQIPKMGKGVLSPPLKTMYITQYFGNTAFATANPQVYNGKGHTGIDLRASIGTPLYASLSGIVVGTGNTDLFPRCYSYGKWVMIKHANGLSTLYAHMSLISVKIGDQLSTGDQIGYTGNTGYSTGPHLHFGVYATEGVQIRKFDSSKNCKGATIPVADFSAYLNPLSYL